LHLLLHSFPTRRSSDLPLLVYHLFLHYFLHYSHSQQFPHHHQCFTRRTPASEAAEARSSRAPSTTPTSPPGAASAAGWPARSTRSEEHTSELQSLAYLV